MQLTIDIDMNQIDYDAINEQIKEKLSEVSPEEILDKYYKTEETVREQIMKLLKEGTDDYIVNREWCTNNSAKQNIQNITEKILRDKLEPICDEILEDYPKEVVEELFNEVLPLILCDIWYKNAEHRFDSIRVHNEYKVRTMIEERVSSIGRR